jgi:enamine deaminase RidA (YjgF/YER057c/UK114 family)
MAIKRSDFTGRFHRIVEAGNVIFLAGVTARNAGGEAGAQTADVLTQIDELLAKAGVSKRDVVSANIWLADIGDFAAMNSAWDAWVDKENAPVRATVESRLARPDLRVEIQVQAVRTAQPPALS